MNATLRFFRPLAIASIVLAAVPRLSAQTNVIADPGFEAGTPNPSWNEASTNFGTPICTAACGTGGIAHQGDWFAWLGGVSFFEESSVSQNMVFGVDTTELTFFLNTACDAGGGPDDFMEVRVDGIEVFRVEAPDCGNLPAGYSQQSVDVSAWADGRVHELEFFSVVDGPGNTNFFVDEVALASSIEAYWPFDKDAQDHSGRGRHGTLEGGASLSPGVVGGALDLVGIDGWVDVADPVLNQLDECSIAFWLRLESLLPGDPSDPLFAIFAEDQFFNHSLHVNVAFWTDPDTIEWALGGNERASVLAPTSAPTQWMHVAMAYSSSAARTEVYVDGTLIETQDHTVPMTCGADSSSTIGAWNLNGSEVRFLDGNIDELSLYSRRLTAAEVAVLAAPVFADGFESGSASAWSGSAP